MKKSLNVLFNKLLDEELETMFGKQYNIKINSFFYSTQKKSFVVDITLICKNCKDDDIELFYPTGLDYIVEECWKFIGVDKPLAVISSIEFVKIDVGTCQ